MEFNITINGQNVDISKPKGQKALSDYNLQLSRQALKVDSFEKAANYRAEFASKGGAFYSTVGKVAVYPLSFLLIFGIGAALLCGAPDWSTYQKLYVAAAAAAIITLPIALISIFGAHDHFSAMNAGNPKIERDMLNATLEAIDREELNEVLDLIKVDGNRVKVNKTTIQLLRNVITICNAFSASLPQPSESCEVPNDIKPKGTTLSEEELKKEVARSEEDLEEDKELAEMLSTFTPEQRLELYNELVDNDPGNRDNLPPLSENPKTYYGFF